MFQRNGLLIVVIVGVVVILLAAAAVFGGGSSPAGAAKDFFASIPLGGPQAAYGKASPAFKSATSADAWAASATYHNLAGYTGSSWTQAQGGGDAVILNGVITLRGGAVQPATVRLIKAAGGWSVYSVDLASAGVAGAPQTAANTSATTGDATATASSSAPVAPSGAPQGTTYGAGAPAAYPPQDQGASAPAPTGVPAPGGYGPSSAQPAATPVMLDPNRIAHDCGPQILAQHGVYSVDIHCLNGVAAAPGTGGRCEAMINDRPATVGFTVQSYDPARDDAELACRLY